jgi:hypothetical protein
VSVSTVTTNWNDSTNYIRLYQIVAGASSITSYTDHRAWVNVTLGGGSGDVATDAIWDAKGDLAVGTGANTAARLAVGTNGQALVADSAEATGVKWATPAGGGDVVGPASATNNSLARFDGTTGKLLKDGAVIGTDVQAYDATLLNAADIGVSVQAYDADLSTLAGLTTTTDNFIQSKASAWASRTPTQVTADLIPFVGDSGSGGSKGLVPTPAIGDATKVLKGDGTWGSVSGDVATDAIWDAKGDLAVGTGANTAARLAVGTNGQALVADSAEATGVKWATPAGGGDFMADGSVPMTGPLVATTIELGHASDTTLARVSAGVVSVEGSNVILASGGNLTGGINSARGNITQHATTMDFFAVTSPDILDGTGSAVTITACVNAPQAGATRKFYPIVATVLTHGATFDIAGNANLTAAAGDCWIIEAKTVSTYRVTAVKEDGTAVVGGSVQIQPISASVGASALTISASALSLDFRSATLTSGAVTTVSGTPANLVISSGSTLGTVNAVQSRIAVLALNNAGTIELAAVNIAGGNDLSETGLISTTAEGGTGAADTANVIYSTTARTNVAYRVIGYIESTQATAGTWATTPSTIQGAGGNAVTAMSSLGYGQTWQNMTGSRSKSTTYYNTTGKPICVSIKVSQAGPGEECYLTINGQEMCRNAAVGAGSKLTVSGIVPPFASYRIDQNGTTTLSLWAELR